MARTRALTLCGTGGMNAFLNLPVTANPLFRAVVAPNAETLYSTAYLDLRDGPVTVSYPPTGGRYVVFQFLDMYSNVIDNAGTSSDGPGGATVTLVPPGYNAPVPGRRIESTTWDLWVLGRTLVAGAGVDPQALQRGYRIGVNRVPVAGATPRLRQQSCSLSSPQNLVSAGAGFFDELADVLAADPPPPADAAVLTDLASVGVTPGSHPSTTGDVEALAAGAGGGNAIVDNAEGVLRPAGSWRTSDVIGRYGTDYMLRAFVTKVGLGANGLEETRYYRATTDVAGAPLTGGRSYTIHLPPANPLVPVDLGRAGWWSVTAYDMDGWLVPNVALRYSYGTDIEPLTRNADGSVDITVGAVPSLAPNWLPAPAGGFQLIFRQYMPTDTGWVPPPIMPV